MDEKNLTTNEENLKENSLPSHQKIEVVPGNVEDLNISKVYTNIDIERPNKKQADKKNIIIPPQTNEE